MAKGYIPGFKETLKGAVLYSCGVSDMKRLISLSLVLSLAVTLVGPIPSLQAAPVVTAPSVILLDPLSNRVLYSRLPHRKQPVASTTKIVTALLILDLLPLDHWVSTPPRMEDIPSSKIYLSEGDQLRVRDLLKATLMKSANDAAVTLAIEAAGSEAEFATWMTHRVQQLGALDTRFTNATGLPGPGQYSTAYDLALIMREAMKNKTLVSMLKQKSTVIQSAQGKRFFLKNHNKMLWQEGNVIGKTGWTRNAKHCFLGIVQMGDRDVVVAVLGSHRLWSDLRALVGKFVYLIGGRRKYVTYGARGDDVLRLQNALKRAGFFRVKATGYFGKETKRAVFRFQRSRRLRVDGIAGPQTRKALSSYY